MLVLGIDPGVTGAWAVVSVDKSGATPPVLVAIGDLPAQVVQLSKTTKRRLDNRKLQKLVGDLLDKHEPDRVVVEKLTGAPGIASTTAFSLGWSASALDAALTASGWQGRYVNPHPSVWKKALGVPADKQASRSRATKLFRSDSGWPRAQDHNRAEAAMLAVYGALSKPR